MPFLVFFLEGSEHSSTCSAGYFGTVLLGTGALEGADSGGDWAGVLRGVLVVFGQLFYGLFSSAGQVSQLYPQAVWKQRQVPNFLFGVDRSEC